MRIKEIFGKYGIRDEANYYFCDYVIPELKICIEFFGDYWHCNPNKYSENYYHPQKKKTAATIWKDDEKRLSAIARLRNFEVYVVWESNQEHSFNQIREVIQNAITSKNCIQKKHRDSTSI